MYGEGCFVTHREATCQFGISASPNLRLSALLLCGITLSTDRSFPCPYAYMPLQLVTAGCQTVNIAARSLNKRRGVDICHSLRGLRKSDCNAKLNSSTWAHQYLGTSELFCGKIT